MRPLTEEQLSMLLSDAEAGWPSSAAFLETGMALDQSIVASQCVEMSAEATLEKLHHHGLVPCGWCFGTGYMRGAYWSTRRENCTHCDGTGRAQ